MLTRAGANVGDIVCVTGTLGIAAAGVRMLLDSRYADNHFRESALKKLFEPQPRIVYGQALADSGAVTALIDTSDGLSLSLYERETEPITCVNECGHRARISERLPVDNSRLRFE